MTFPRTRFVRAVGTMVGSVVGVGVFGLPYAFSQSGAALGALILVFVACAVTALQLMYAEVALHTPGTHRLVGYVRAYLGEGWGRFALVALSASMWGAMLAYLIVGGRFLQALFAPVGRVPEWVFACALAALALALMNRGIQALARREVLVVGVLLFLFAFMILAALVHVHAPWLGGVHWQKALVPYGVVLFALSGMGVVPELKAILSARYEKHLPSVIMAAMAGISILYLVFGLTVLAALGPRTTQDAFDGLSTLLGGGFQFVAALLGSICVLSIFTVVGMELSNTFRYDFHVSRRLSLLFAVLVPLVLYVAGLHGLVDVLDVAGSVFGGVLGVLIVAMYERMRAGPLPFTHQCLRLPRVASWCIGGVFLLGLILTIRTFLLRI